MVRSGQSPLAPHAFGERRQPLGPAQRGWQWAHRVAGAAVGGEAPPVGAGCAVVRGVEAVVEPEAVVDAAVIVDARVGAGVLGVPLLGAQTEPDRQGGQHHAQQRRRQRGEQRERPITSPISVMPSTPRRGGQSGSTRRW